MSYGTFFLSRLTRTLVRDPGRPHLGSPVDRRKKDHVVEGQAHPGRLSEKVGQITGRSGPEISQVPHESGSDPLVVSHTDAHGPLVTVEIANDLHPVMPSRDGH
jgi:hypothetical protein